MYKTILFTLIGSLLFASAERESEQIKGVLLVDETAKIRKADFEKIEGVQFDGVLPPGGNASLAEALISGAFPLTANGAKELCDAIASIYRTESDFRVAVSVPEQDTSSGVVQLVLAPERLGELKVKHSKPESIKKWVRLSSNDAINEKTLRQDIAWMNTNPFRSVDVAYQKSETPGVTDVDLLVNQKKNWKFSTGVDNTGTMPIGTTRLFAKMDVNDFIFTDHTLSVKAKAADHVSESYTYDAVYTAPLPWRNTLKISGSYSGTDPKREPIYPHKHRESYQASVRYAIPQWFSSNAWIDAITYEAGADFKGTNTNLEYEDDPTPVDKRLTFVGQFVGKVTASRKRGGNKMAADISLVGSPAEMLPHQSAVDFANLRANATAQYIYSRVGLSIEQSLGSYFNLFAQSRGHFSPSILIPSERFSLGGASTVRGYDEKVVSGDNSICSNLELRTRKFAPVKTWAPKVSDALSFVGFVDAGYAWYNEPVVRTPDAEALLGLGTGIRYAVGSYFTSKLDVGFPLKAVQKDSGDPRLHFSAVFSY